MPISRVHILKLCTPMFLLTFYQIDEWTGTSTHLPSGILPTNQKVIQEFEYFPHIRHTLKFCPKISKEESYHWKKFPEKGPRFQLLMTVLRLPAIPLCSTPICYGFDKYPQLFKSSICSNTHSNNTYTKSILIYEKEGGRKTLVLHQSAISWLDLFAFLILFFMNSVICLPWQNFFLRWGARVSRKTLQKAHDFNVTLLLQLDIPCDPKKR